MANSVTDNFVSPRSQSVPTSPPHRRSGFSASFAQRPAGLHHVTEIVALRELAPGVVLADGHVRLKRELAGGGRELLRRFVNHTVVVRRDGQWRFQSLRAHPLPAESRAS